MWIEENVEYRKRAVEVRLKAGSFTAEALCKARGEAEADVRPKKLLGLRFLPLELYDDHQKECFPKLWPV